MKFSNKIKIDLGGEATIDIDLSRVEMDSSQSKIVGKLMSALKDENVQLSDGDNCEAGACLASKYLEIDEFESIRGLKATLGSDTVSKGLICDFCLKCVSVPH